MRGWKCCITSVGVVLAHTDLCWEGKGGLVSGTQRSVKVLAVEWRQVQLGHQVHKHCATVLTAGTDTASHFARCLQHLRVWVSS